MESVMFLPPSVEELMQLNQQQRQQHQIGGGIANGHQAAAQPVEGSGRSLERDKQLMPPPPPPPVSTGEKRPAEQDGNPKRVAGPGFGPEADSVPEQARERVRDEEEDRNNRSPPGGPNSRVGGDFHGQRGGGGGGNRPSFNHYSSKPQLYNASMPFHMHGMYAPPPPPPPPGQQALQPLLQPPPPPPPSPHQQHYGSNYYTSPNQYNPYWMMPQ